VRKNDEKLEQKTVDMGEFILQSLLTIKNKTIRSEKDFTISSTV